MRATQSPHVLRAGHAPRSEGLLLSRFNPRQGRETPRLQRALIPSSPATLTSQPLPCHFLGTPLRVPHANPLPASGSAHRLPRRQRHPPRRLLACAVPSDGSWKPSSPPPTSHTSILPRYRFPSHQRLASHVLFFPCRPPSHGTPLQPSSSAGHRPSTGMASAFGGSMADPPGLVCFPGAICKEPGSSPTNLCSFLGVASTCKGH